MNPDTPDGLQQFETKNNGTTQAQAMNPDTPDGLQQFETKNNGTTQAQAPQKEKNKNTSRF